MSHESIFELSHYSKFEIFNQIKRNCESERPGAVVEIKYGDLIRLAACSQHLARMLFEWDTQLYRSLDQYMIHKITSIYIDFEEVYKRLATASSREKETYWSSLSHAIRDAGPKQVVLRYAPESYHSDHMEAFHTVMGQLQNKLNLKELDIYIPGYTLEGLGKLKSLETLSLNIRMDIDDLVESCKQNKNLKNLSYMNNETGGKRLATIAPHCGELEELTFKMRPDCDASEYKPLAKIPKLNHLKIAGVHERGTLQPLLEACVAKRRKLTRLSVDDVPLDKSETQAMAQIETLTKVKCGFDDPQSIGLLSQLTKLGFLDILSKHDFLAISEQVLSILKDSIAEKWIDIVDINTNIWYQPSAGELILTIRGDNVNASDFGPLATLPGLCSLEISGSPQIGSLKPILNELVAAFRKAPTLTSLRLGKITAAEVAIVSQIASLKRLECGIAEKEQIPLPKEMTEPVPSSSRSAQKILASQNAELLAQLPLLEEITFLYLGHYPQ
ncbi:uncharacterized protein LOC117901804 [Drosophila subobscura]|uniref:uncharacterized protein LOC117901804 n=1 Tax=Drosophila subobscura TaxID=7241 RepID=UPI00155A2CF1|nr:uncharacterized protein LOC117901804 [Drosophila subobscura]